MSRVVDLYVALNFMDKGLPVLVTPKSDCRLSDITVDGSASPRARLWPMYQDQIRSVVDEHLSVQGGVLFRGFVGAEPQDKFCNEFARVFSDELLAYDFGSTPRTDLGDGVYTATEYPSHQVIPLHNEQSYTLQWPLRIWFHCVIEPEEGGETPIADSRRIYNKIPVGIRERFEEKKLLYVRNYGNGLDLAWEQVFSTASKSNVEKYCRENRIGFQWKEDDELRTWQKCQATAKHHTTNEWVWFNQAHLFHVSNIERSAREALLDVVEPEDLPRNVYYGDGSDIEETVLEDIRGVLDEESIKFSWQQGDFLMLDNMLVAHGRSTFSGKRKIVVAMANGFSVEH